MQLKITKSGYCDRRVVLVNLPMKIYKEECKVKNGVKPEIFL